MLIVPSTINAPAAITILFNTPALGVELTKVTGVTLYMLRRDGTTATLTMTVVTQTATQLVAQYAFVGTEVTTTGAYLLAPQLTVSGGFYPAETVTMMVTSPWQGTPQLQDQSWVIAASLISSNPYIPAWQVISGVGSPNGVVSGSPGALYVNTSGGSGTTLYVKESGAGTNTGWVGK
jgi:hypothetical protein